jgi:hypothetical protein
LLSKLYKDDNFYGIATSKKKQYLGILNGHLVDFKVFDTWTVKIEVYEEIFDELIDNLKKQSLDKIKTSNIVRINYIN